MKLELFWYWLPCWPNPNCPSEQGLINSWSIRLAPALATTALQLSLPQPNMMMIHENCGIQAQLDAVDRSVQVGRSLICWGGNLMSNLLNNIQGRKLGTPAMKLWLGRSQNRRWWERRLQAWGFRERPAVEEFSYSVAANRCVHLHPLIPKLSFNVFIVGALR